MTLLLELAAAVRYAPIAASDNSGSLESVWLAKIHAIRTETRDVRILFVGDSTVRAAMDAEFFSKITGVRAANLALVGDFTSYGDYAVLSVFLANHPPPRAVLLWHTVDVWPRSVSEHLVAYTRCDLPFGTVPLVRRDTLPRPGKFSWPVVPVENNLRALALCIPSYRYRHWIRGDFDFLPKEEMATLSASAIDRQIDTLVRSDLSISPGTAYWLIQVRELCRKRGIMLLTSRSPLHERVSRNEAAMAGIERQNKQIGDLLGFAPEIRDLMKVNPVFAAGEGRDDKDHVSATGRERSTRMYADRLRQSSPELFRGEHE